MANEVRQRPLWRRPTADAPRPVGWWLFWASLLLSGLCGATVVWMVIANLPTGVLGIGPRVVVVALLAIFVCASLATTEIIPWGSRSWVHWRSPKVLGAVIYLVLGAAAFVAGVATIFNPPAAEQKTLVATQRAVIATGQKVDAITTMLKPPASPHLMNGVWGEPGCAVTFNLALKGDALIMTTKTLPAGYPAWRSVATITTRTTNEIQTVVDEPLADRGQAAVFTYRGNGVTEHLIWRPIHSQVSTTLDRCP